MSLFKSPRKLMLGTLLAALFAASGAVLAFGHDGCHGMGREMSPRMQERMTARMEQHHARLHEALKLTPAQEDAWKTYLAQGKPQPPAGQPLSREEMARLSTPERAERMQGVMRDRLAMMEKHTAALKTFYATLTPEQKKTFDEMHQHKPRGPRPAQGQGQGAGQGPGAEGRPAPASQDKPAAR